MSKNYHVTPHENGWGVKGEGNSKYSNVYSTQSEAIARGKELAQGQESELLIHGKDGRIRERNSYGNDPYPPKG